LLSSQVDVFHEGYHDPHKCKNQAPSLIMGISASSSQNKQHTNNLLRKL
jgi:hypothetical protein